MGKTRKYRGLVVLSVQQMYFLYDIVKAALWADESAEELILDYGQVRELRLVLQDILGALKRP